MKKIWRRLICLALLAAMCLSWGLAFSDGSGSLTITIGNSNSEFDRKGIKIELYRVSTNVIQEDWSMLPEFSTVKLPSIQEESKQAAKTQAANDDIRKIIGDKQIKPTAVAKTDQNGQIKLGGLEPGVYYGRVTEKPEYLKVRDFLISVPQMDMDNGEWNYNAQAELKHEYVTPPPEETSNPPPSPSPTPTVFATPTVTPTETPDDSDPPPPNKNETPTPIPSATPRPTPTPPPEPHKLIIHYLYADTGETAFPDYNDTLWEGDPYDVWSPVLPNYWYDIAEVADIMPNHDMEYTVLYFTKKTGWNYRNIDDYETALGIGMIQMHVGVCYE